MPPKNTLKKIFQEIFSPRDDFWEQAKFITKIPSRYDYPYSIFAANKDVELSKVFDYYNKKWGELFNALEQAPAILGNKNYKLPIVMGSGLDDKVIIKDLLSFPHLLVAGQTGSGKTIFLHNLLISLLYLSHPEYLKIVVLDKKATSFSVLKNVVNVESDTLKIAKVLELLCKEMHHRNQFIDGREDSVKDSNAKAYQKRNKAALKPYIVVVVEEFAVLNYDVLNLASALKKEKGREEDVQLLNRTMSNVSKLAAMSRSSGFCLVFCTQYPTKESMLPAIKVNMVDRFCMLVDSSKAAEVILGNRNRYVNHEGFLPEFFKKQGEGVLKSKGTKTKVFTFFTHFYALKMAAAQLSSQGFDFRLYEKL